MSFGTLVCLTDAYMVDVEWSDDSTEGSCNVSAGGLVSVFALVAIDGAMFEH